MKRQAVTLEIGTAEWSGMHQLAARVVFALVVVGVAMGAMCAGWAL